MQKQKILIVGNGKIGQAIFHLLHSNEANKRHLIEVYDRNRKKNKSGKSLEDCVLGADFIFLCIPSWVENEVLLKISPRLKKGAVLITLSKGLQIVSRITMDQLLEKDTPGASWTLLSGPMFAPEIMENKMSYGVLATKDKKVFKRIFALFAGGRLKLEYEKRAHGVALVAVLKNVYALFFGMLEGAGERNNSRGFFASRVIGEMRQIMKILKSEEKIIFGTAGMGDFIATINSEHSQNRKVGRKIFERGRAISKSEGLVSLPSLLKMLGPKAKQLPILYFLQRVISQRRDAKKEMEKFLRDI